MADVLDLFNYAPVIQQAAQANGLRPELLHSVIQTESGGRPDAVSPKGALGLMQVMPATAAAPGFGVKPFDPSDPVQNINGGAAYLAALVKHYGGDEQKALAAYNAGPARVDSGQPLPKETQAYVPTVEKGASPQAMDILDLFNGTSQPKAAEDQGFLANAVSDAGENIAGFGHMLANPGETLATTAKLGVGTLQRGADLLGIPTGAADQLVGDQRAYANAAARHFADAYGSWQKIKHSLYTHPVSTVMDASALLGGAGELADVANLGRTADVLNEASRLTDPLRLPSNVASLAQPAERYVARRIIRSNVKPSDALVLRNPKVDIPGVILREGFSPGFRGENQAVGQYEQALNGVDQLTAAAPGVHDLQPVINELETLKQKYLQNPAGTDLVNAVQRKIDELQNHPLYSEDAYGTRMMPQTTQVPTGVVDAAGNPIMQSQTVMMPQQVVTGRTLVDQPATQLNVMKRAINSENPRAYGELQGAEVEAEKAEARALKGILDRNVPGVQPLNQRAGEMKVAAEALNAMGRREEKKYPIGLLDYAASGDILGAGALSHVAAHPLAAAGGALAALPLVAGVAIKHPSTAFPIARMVNRLGNASYDTLPLVGKIAGPASRLATPLTRINAATANAGTNPLTNQSVQLRPVTPQFKADAHNQYLDWLDSKK